MLCLCICNFAPSLPSPLLFFPQLNISTILLSEMASEIKNDDVFVRNWGWFKALPGKIGTKIVENARKIKKLGQDDPRRIIHSLKVGLAITLVSLIYYFQPLYEGFGDSAMWAILTVIVVFEFSVG